MGIDWKDNSKRLLKDLLKNPVYVLTGNFVLASLKSDRIYVDARTALLDSEILDLATHLFQEEIIENHRTADILACSLSVGSGMILGALLKTNDKEGIPPFAGLVVRKEAKDHGTQKRVEWERQGWLVDGKLKNNVSVVFIEDIVTTGNSALEAIKEIEKEGLNVEAVLCLVDRGENTEKMFAEKGYEFFSIFKLQELL